ncbi:tetraspanin-10-like [Bombina bombina]|uniref:tetraspanin-10-like n=1 Tax=Bombina bombina TaxID=8345 RepID=UPI00235AC6A0|nr:tetraspanin-10-like [Bombina bombina]
MTFFLRKKTEEPNESSRLLTKGDAESQKATFGALHNRIQNGKAAIDLAEAVSPKRGLLSSPDVLISFIKYFMFFYNFVFSVLGLAVFGIGVWGLVDKQSLMPEQISNLGTDPMLFFVLMGLVVSVLSMSGCAGFLRENSCLLKLFSAGIGTLLITQLLSAAIIFSFREQIRNSAQNFLLVAVSRYQDDSDLRFIMDELQLGMECCGVQSYQDWEFNLYFNCSSPGVLACGVPYSCCIDPLENGTVPNSQCGYGVLEMGEILAGSRIYLGGCVPQLSLWLQHGMWDITTGLLLVTTVEVICILCARRMLENIKMIKSYW